MDTEKCRKATAVDLLAYMLAHGGQAFFQEISNEISKNTPQGRSPSLNWSDGLVFALGVAKLAINNGLCQPIKP